MCGPVAKKSEKARGAARFRNRGRQLPPKSRLPLNFRPRGASRWTGRLARPTLPPGSPVRLFRQTRPPAFLHRRPAPSSSRASPRALRAAWPRPARLRQIPILFPAPHVSDGRPEQALLDRRWKARRRRTDSVSMARLGRGFGFGPAPAVHRKPGRPLAPSECGPGFGRASADHRKPRRTCWPLPVRPWLRAGFRRPPKTEKGFCHPSGGSLAWEGLLPSTENREGPMGPFRCGPAWATRLGRPLEQPEPCGEAESRRPGWPEPERGPSGERGGRRRHGPGLVQTRAAWPNWLSNTIYNSKSAPLLGLTIKSPQIGRIQQGSGPGDFFLDSR